MFDKLARVQELRDNLTAYDAAYVALAEALGCALVTADARLASSPGPACPIGDLGVEELLDDRWRLSPRPTRLPR